MTRTELFAAILGMIALEVLHLKWIWWNYWDCSKCGRKRRECGHGAKWMLYL